MKNQKSDKKIWDKILDNKKKIKSPILMVKIDVEDYQIVVTHGLN